MNNNMPQKEKTNIPTITVELAEDQIDEDDDESYDSE